MLTSTTATRPIIRHQCAAHQVRHATYLRRPRRPYTFTQLITLSDGSTFTHRTTSPAPIYRSTKDTRNNPLWNPSSQKLLNIEEDEAGRLKRFRRRFGRGYDASSMGTGEEKRNGMDDGAADGEGLNEESLLELISGYGKDGGKPASLEKDEKAQSKASKSEGKK